MMVHGNFLQELIEFFTNESKIDKKYLHETNKLDKKKHKSGF